MMRRIFANQSAAIKGFATLAALLAAATSAQAQVTLGRLFATPAERAAMEATRGASAALAPNSQGQQPAPGMPGGPAMPEDARGPAGPGDPGQPGGPPGGPGAPGATNATQPPPSLVMSGVLRRSGSRDTTVWLNDQPQYGAQKSLSQRGGAATPNLTVTLPSGKKILLKPGQRYDLNEGRVKDVNEP